ncbi:PAS domain S-box protein [Phenylobacterium sp. J426]|uniref:PAS domain-containing sensor histidine kinase n=1 Tax=Phenylobacterium sp. J426 TaxID=2898439 RepID=UPI0021510EA2|nr:PAS domain S-box protein [Phenylobacterium sp. J426]MCR5876672.1 PAS domain S-box protein [Phenylobacterium sp. J426]
MRPWHEPDGAVGGAMLFSEVITGEVEARRARERTEAELAQSEARFRAAVQAVHGVLWTNDPEGRMVGEQPGWAALTGQSREDYEGFGWSKAVHPEDAEPTVEAWLAAVRERRPFIFEHRLKRADGAWRRFAIRAVPVLDRDGDIQEWVGVHTDVTAERDAEARLQESEARLRAVFEAVPVGLVIAEAPTGRIVGGNRQVEEVFGHSVLPSPDIDSYRDWVSHHADGGRVLGEEYPLSRALRGEAERPRLDVLYERGDGRQAWVRLVASPIRNEFSDITGAVVACLDIDGERRAREALARLNQSLEAEVAERTEDRDRMWRLTTDLMLVAGLDASIQAVNPRWSTLLGWREEELIGAEFMSFVHPDDREATLAEVGRLAEGATTFRFENRYRARDGDYRWISWIAVPSEGLIHAAGRDVTEEKAAAAELARAQDALRQSQKLESMGQLTGGVAHDFNNLLTPIIGSLDMLQRRGLGGERERRLMDGALQSAERAKVLVQRLLAFARRQPLQAVPVHLGPVIEGMADLISSTSGPQIRVTFDVEPGLPPVMADRNQLEMAILNLAVNARDAMPHGGRLTLSAEAATVTRPEKDEPRPGRYVRLRVADTGHGMDEETLARAVRAVLQHQGPGSGHGPRPVHGARPGGAARWRADAAESSGRGRRRRPLASRDGRARTGRGRYGSGG